MTGLTFELARRATALMFDQLTADVSAFWIG